MFKKFKKKAAVNRILEEQLYTIVAKEIKNGIIREGLWAKALAHSKGDQKKAKALYIQYRAQSIKDEFELLKLNDRKQVEDKNESKKIPTDDPDYIICPYCNFTQWIGYKKCQKCGKNLE